MSNGFIDTKRLSAEESKVANRLAKLAQIVATGMNISFTVTTFREGAPPVVQQAQGTSIASTEQVLIMMMRLDNKLVELLQGVN